MVIYRLYTNLHITYFKNVNLIDLPFPGSLVHLRLGIALTYVDVALVLFNCAKLEALEIDYVDSDRGNEGLSRSGVRGLALSVGDVPQVNGTGVGSIIKPLISH